MCLPVPHCGTTLYIHACCMQDCDISHKTFWQGARPHGILACWNRRIWRSGYSYIAIGIGIGIGVAAATAVIGIRLPLLGKAKCAIYNLSGIKVSYNGATCRRTCRASVNFFYARKERGARSTELPANLTSAPQTWQSGLGKWPRDKLHQARHFPSSLSSEICSTLGQHFWIGDQTFGRRRWRDFTNQFISN